MDTSNLIKTLDVVNGVCEIWVIDLKKTMSLFRDDHIVVNESGEHIRLTQRYMEDLVLPSKTVDEHTGEVTIIDKNLNDPLTNEGIACWNYLGCLDMNDIKFECTDPKLIEFKTTDERLILQKHRNGDFKFNVSTINLNPDICTNILKMNKISDGVGTPNTLGNSLTGDDNNTGFLSDQLIYISFIDSLMYQGLLVPYCTILSKLNPNGKQTDNWDIEMEVKSFACPDVLPIDGWEQRIHGFGVWRKARIQTITKKYNGAMYSLIQKFE